jgi:branched-chain amino acid transport system ATP-binding protein
MSTYYQDSYILQGVTLDLNAGEVVALLGRNGVGKTTLARSILGLTPAKRGTILFKGIDITHMPAHRIARMGIGIVPQGRHVFRSLNVKEHLYVTARGQGVGTSIQSSNFSQSQSPDAQPCRQAQRR